MGPPLTDEQQAILQELTADDAIRLIEAGEIATWKSICEQIQELARSGSVLPVNTLRFYSAIRWDFDSRRYVPKSPSP